MCDYVHFCIYFHNESQHLSQEISLKIQICTFSSDPKKKKKKGIERHRGLCLATMTLYFPTTIISSSAASLKMRHPAGHSGTHL